MSDSTFRWATIMSVGPLTIRLDGETASIGTSPDSIVDLSGITVGGRVWCQLHGRRVVILGIAGGTKQTTQSGTVTVSVTANTVSAGAVTFGQQFASIPTLSLTANSTHPDTMQAPTFTGLSVSGFTVQFFRTTSFDTEIDWIAVGERP